MTYLIISYLSAFEGFIEYNLGFDGYDRLSSDFGEGALKKATTSKDGSRRVNYPILTWRGGDKK